MATLVDSLYQENVAIVEYLLAQGEISFSNTLGSAVPKVVLLAAASHMETEVCAHINAFYDKVTNRHPEATAFVNNKAVSRQYHTYFDWKNGNANAFFGLFGEDALNNFKAKLKEDPVFAGAVKEFCNLGNLRNQLVHGNYASFVLDKTADEVFTLYRQARVFVDAIPQLIEHRQVDVDPETTE
jgi:RiboL-PSP-HEPN